MEKATYRRQRAVLLTARALSVEDGDRDSARAFALEANKLAPTLVPAAALAARLVAEHGELRKASRIIDKAWRANPHPQLAQACADLRYGDAARDRLKRIEALAQKAPRHIESALAVARAALDAREFDKARATLAPHLAAPTRRVALLMAALERAEHGDEGRAREWVSRALHAAADPAWTADGYVSDRWLPASPVSGRLDAFEWRVPLTGIGHEPVIEPEPAPEPPSPAAIVPPEAADARQASAPLSPAAPAADAAPPTAEPGHRAETAPADEVPKAEPIIPLVHAPDDPGPDSADDTGSLAQSQSGAGWRKIFE